MSTTLTEFCNITIVEPSKVYVHSDGVFVGAMIGMLAIFILIMLQDSRMKSHGWSWKK